MAKEDANDACREHIRRNLPLLRLLERLNHELPREQDPDFERERADFERSLGRRVFADDADDDRGRAAIRRDEATMTNILITHDPDARTLRVDLGVSGLREGDVCRDAVADDVVLDVGPSDEVIAVTVLDVDGVELRRLPPGGKAGG